MKLRRRTSARIAIAAVAFAALVLSGYWFLHPPDGMRGFAGALFVVSLMTLGLLVKLVEWRIMYDLEEREFLDVVRFSRLSGGPPIIVHRRVGLQLIWRRVELLAFYPDAVVIKRIRDSRDLPDPVFAADGVQTLARLPSGPAGRIIPLNSVQTVELREAPTPAHQPKLVVKLSDAERDIVFPVRARVFAGIEAELPAILADRFHRLVWAPEQRRRIRVRTAIAVCLFLDVALGYVVLFGERRPGDVLTLVRERAGLGVLAAIFAYVTLLWNGLLIFIASRGTPAPAAADTTSKD